MIGQPHLSDKERQLFQNLHEERLHDAKTFNKPSYKGFWTGIVDKYKEKAHFVYELLQNADDAKATEACFSLENNRLVFRHNGTVGFSISREDDTVNKGHINAITGVGNSTKNDVQGNTIGKFGVGFKAVSQYTAVPHIYDDKFWFKIENYIVPSLLDEDFPGRKAGETVFVFPFASPREAYSEITERLRSLDNPILFLRNLKNVRIDTPEKKGIIYDKTIIEQHKSGDITHELIQIGNYGSITRLHMFSKAVTIDDNGKKYNQMISVGYFLNSEGKLDVSETRKVFCFFPTAEDFKLKCVVHAPFLLVDSRQQLKDNDINTELKKLLADLAAKALVILKDYAVARGKILIDENIFSIIPEKESYYYYHKDKDLFRKAYISQIEETPLLLGRNNRYISSAEALICRPISMMNILTDEQLTELKAPPPIDEDDEDDDDIYEDERHDWHFLREETQKLYAQDYVEEVLDELEIAEFDGVDLAREIDSEFMGKHGLKWAKRLYAHLRNEQVGLWKRGENSKKKITDTPFCLSPIVLSDHGDWVKPYLESGALNVYLPISGSSEGYTFISKDYLNDKDCMSFFAEMGLKEPNAWDYIRSVVLDKYKHLGQISREVINSDFELIYNHVSKLGTLKEKEDAIDILKDSFMLVCPDRNFRVAKELYEDSPALRRFFKNTDECFIDSKYYQSFIDKYSIQQFNAFIRSLGIDTLPRVESFNRSFAYKEAESLNIGTYTWSQVEDFRIAGFKDWKPSSIEDSKAFWNWYSQLVKNKECLVAKYSYQYYQIRRGTTASTFLKEVQDKSWIITLDGECLKPSEVSLEQYEEAEYQIDYDLIRLFGIEKKSKSLQEMGASESQIKQNEKGKLAEKYGLNTEAEFKEAIEALREKREREKSAAEKSRKESQNNADGKDVLQDTMRKTSLDEMSSSTKDYGQSSPKVQKSMDERVQEITQKLADEANRRIEEENLRAEVNDYEKYTKKWFSSLLELEYSSASGDIDYGRNQIKITFEKFRKESGSSQIYVLSNPSRNIPIWIEEIGGLSVKFTFLNKDDVTFSFDVANVKDFTLRLKAKLGEVQQLDKIDWSKCTKAVVEVNSPSEIMNKLKSAFSLLEFDDDFNFKDNLDENISFVFGPPGTGKTTRLAEIIRTKMERDDCQILVLAPTNKACDVLTRKLIDSDESASSWLARFVASGDDVIEAEGVLVDRDSDIWKRDKCCIVSTIARLPYDGFADTDGGSCSLREMEWDFVIIDEASMIPLVQIIYALFKMKGTNFIIAGDPLQIPPIVMEKAWEGENIYTMVKLQNFENPTTTPRQFDVEKLGTQYRSVPAIGSLFSRYSYDGKLLHSRSSKDLKHIPFGMLNLKPVTFMPFRVERFDSIFGAKKLNGSNVHIYSAVFAVEAAAYISRQQTEEIRIGVICPYAPQAQLINKMIEQRADIPAYVDIQCGTIHGFQGDQCEIIITVLNPPTGIKAAPERIMLNNKKVLNVAISRASDYLVLMLPHPDSYGYENLIEINNLCHIAKANLKDTLVINSDDVEKAIFGRRNYVEENTFVTTHQLANVYSSAAGLYEIRIDDNAVDIQVGGDAYSVVPRPEENDPFVSEVTVSDRPESHVECNTLTENAPQNVAPAENAKSQKEIEVSNLLAEIGVSGKDAVSLIRTLILRNSSISHYVAIQFVGNAEFRRLYALPEVSKDDIKAANKGIPSGSTPILPWMYLAHDTSNCPIKKHTGTRLSDFRYSDYILLAGSYFKPKQNLQPVAGTKTKCPRISVPKSYITHFKEEKEEDKLCNKYEYGLSDW